MEELKRSLKFSVGAIMDTYFAGLTKRLLSGRTQLTPLVATIKRQASVAQWLQFYDVGEHQNTQQDLIL